jgi:hypothetical protein
MNLLINQQYCSHNLLLATVVLTIGNLVYIGSAWLQLASTTSVPAFIRVGAVKEPLTFSVANIKAVSFGVNITEQRQEIIVTVF